MELEQFKTSNGVSLPRAYIEFLRASNGAISRSFNDCPDEFPDSDGREWHIKDIAGLTETITVGGAGEQPFHGCVQLFLKLHLEFTGAEYVDSNTGPLAPDRVCGGFAFAEDNADYLYLDPFDGFSVWIFHHDGADVEFVAADFEVWLAKSTPGD